MDVYDILRRPDNRKVPEWLVFFQLKFKWKGADCIGRKVQAKTLVEAVKNAEEWLGTFAFKEKHPIDGAEVVEAYKQGGESAGSNSVMCMLTAKIVWD